MESSNEHKVLKVLLAEDNLINQKVASININKMGHSVDLANNGQIALEKFQGNDYDLIFMDLQMPVMDGIEATKRIREFESKSKHGKAIRIVAMTASAMPEDKYICYEAGMNDYVSKPFNKEDLYRIFNELLSA
jgi:two-component system, sensor histidine kinase